MARIGTFDKDTLPKSIFDKTLTNNGWYVDDLIKVTSLITNNIRVGTSTPALYKVGTQNVTRIYLGSTLVYQA